MALSKDFQKTIIAGGHKITVSISPCSWMHENYGLQIEARADDLAGRGVFLHEKKPFAQCSEADVDALLAKHPITFVKCSRPGCTRERMADPKTNRFAQIPVKMGKGTYGGDTIPDTTRPLCEECFLSDLDAKMKVEQAKETAKREREEAVLFARGMRWAVDAWIHPKAGGDDYQITYYFADEPDLAAVKKKIARISVRTDDVAKPRALKPLAAVAPGVPFKRFDPAAEDMKWLQKRCVGHTMAREKGKHATLGQGWKRWNAAFTPEVKAKVLGWWKSQGIAAEAVEFANEIVPQTKAAQTVASSGVKKGSFIRWTGRGQSLTGEVLRVNAKTLSIRAYEGSEAREYRVGLGGKVEVLSPVEREAVMKAFLASREKAIAAPGLTEVQAPVPTATPTADGGARVTLKPVEAALRDAGWLHDGETMGIDSVTPIRSLYFKDEDAVGSEAMGPVFANLANGECRPLMREKTGAAKWFMISEARKVARLLHLTLKDTVA